MSDAPTERGFTFPMAMEISAMGLADAELERIVPEVLAALGVAIIEGAIRSRASREGRYVSITVAYHCTNREMHETVQRELRAHPAVKWVL